MKQQPSKFLGEVAAALWKTVFWVLHTVLSPSDKQSSQCQPRFLPSNLPCGLLLCGGAHKQSIEKNKIKLQQWVALMMPCSCVRLYTKQHAHKIWTVLYCDGSACCVIHKYGGVLPGLQRKINHSDVERLHTYRYFMYVCLLVCCSPVAPAAHARWPWISCCYFLIRQSSPVSCKHILKGINIMFNKKVKVNQAQNALFLPRVKWEDWNHCHVNRNMKLPLAASYISLAQRQETGIQSASKRRVSPARSKNKTCVPAKIPTYFNY